MSHKTHSCSAVTVDALSVLGRRTAHGVGMRLRTKRKSVQSMAERQPLTSAPSSSPAQLWRYEHG